MNRVKDVSAVDSLWKGLYNAGGVAALTMLVLMIVPSSAGTIGLYFSLASLVPWAIWLVLVGRRFFQLGKSAG